MDAAGGARRLPGRAVALVPPALADLLCPAGGTKLPFVVVAELFRLSRPVVRDDIRGGCDEEGWGGGGGGAGDAELDGGWTTSSTNAGVNGTGSSPDDVISGNNGIC